MLGACLFVRPQRVMNIVTFLYIDVSLSAQSEVEYSILYHPFLGIVFFFSISISVSTIALICADGNSHGALEFSLYGKMLQYKNHLFAIQIRSFELRVLISEVYVYDE